MKIIDKKKFLLTTHGSKRQNPLMDEVKILSNLDHPNIIGIKRAFETESSLYLVLELVTGGELLDKIAAEKKFSEDKARNYFKQILEATKYLHEQGIAHRDLKPENILLKDQDSEIIKISDFGLSRVVDQASFMKTICGTPQYVAPEILSTCTRSPGYGLACDLWSSGVILYIMLVGYHPFKENNENKTFPVYEQIQKGEYEFAKEHWSRISPSAIYLIKRLLTVDPRKRITAAEALESAWLRGLPIDENEMNNYKNNFSSINDDAERISSSEKESIENLEDLENNINNDITDSKKRKINKANNSQPTITTLKKSKR